METDEVKSNFGIAAFYKRKAEFYENLFNGHTSEFPCSITAVDRLQEMKESAEFWSSVYAQKAAQLMENKS